MFLNDAEIELPPNVWTVSGVKTDGLTDQNPYIGELTKNAKTAYADALMSDVDEKVVRAFESKQVIGRPEFADTLKMERGRYRIKRDRPVNRVRIYQ